VLLPAPASCGGGVSAVLQVAAIEGEILLVSQFTLYGRLKKPKPDYSKAMGPEQVCVEACEA
jgi:D-Tyr-tRNAtyr deacylase